MKAENQPIKPVKYTLQELLDKITPENLHPECDYGKPVGKESI
jgi:antitoxin component of MazEF toxin-antitoxin module